MVDRRKLALKRCDRGGGKEGGRRGRKEREEGKPPSYSSIVDDRMNDQLTGKVSSITISCLHAES